MLSIYNKLTIITKKANEMYVHVSSNMTEKVKVLNRVTISMITCMYSKETSQFCNLRLL